MNQPIILQEEAPQSRLQALKETGDSSPQRAVAFRTEAGLWAAPPADADLPLVAPDGLELANRLTDAVHADWPQSVPRVVRLVPSRDELLSIATALVDGHRVVSTSPGDTRHAGRTPPDGLMVEVAEWLEGVPMQSVLLDELVPPNHRFELIFTDDMAAGAMKNKRPEVACLVYGEAFRTMPPLGYYPDVKERFEMSAIVAGDTEVPHFGVTGEALFERSMAYCTAHPLPVPAHDFSVRVVFARSDPDELKPDGPIAVRARRPSPIDAAVLSAGNLLLSSAYAEAVAGELIDFDRRMTADSLGATWRNLDKIGRMKVDLACLRRFAHPVSAFDFISPKIEQAIAAVMAIRGAGIPPRMALHALEQEITRWEQA